MRSVRQAFHQRCQAIIVAASRYVLHAYNLIHYGRSEVFANIVIETFSPCNRTCACCPVGYERRPVAKMSEQLFRRIIDQLARRRYRGEIALHFYNEPTLDDRLLDFIRYTHEKCPKSFVYFASNGDFMDIERFRDFVRNGLSHVHLTQYDPQPKPTLQRFLESLTNEDRRHVSFGVRIADEVSRWSNRAGLVPSTRLPRSLDRRCTRPDRQLVINAEGRVAQCCCDYRPAGDLGDAATGNVFDIWRSQKFRMIRASLRNGNRSALELCRRCDWDDEVVKLPRRCRSSTSRDRAGS